MAAEASTHYEGASRRALVVVGGEDEDHDLLGAASALTSLVAGCGFVASPAVGLKRFVDPLPTTAGADAYVLFTDQAEFPSAQQSALAALVAEGRGLVAVHCALRLPEPSPGLAGASPFERLVGGYWLTGDPEIGLGSDVEPDRRGRDGPQGGGRPDAAPWTLRGGAVPVRLTGDGHEVRAWVCPGDGGPVPAVYRRTHGRGRVCYLAVGHDRSSWESPTFRSLVREALGWVTGREDGASSCVDRESGRY